MKLRPSRTQYMFLAAELIRKLDNANDKYGRGMLTVGQWQTALARACEGAVSFAFEMGMEEAEKEIEGLKIHIIKLKGMDQPVVSLEQPGVKRCV